MNTQVIHRFHQFIALILITVILPLSALAERSTAIVYFGSSVDKTLATRPTAHPETTAPLGLGTAKPIIPQALPGDFRNSPSLNVSSAARHNNAKFEHVNPSVGDAAFLGSVVGQLPVSPIIGVVVGLLDKSYTLLSADGDLVTFAFPSPGPVGPQGTYSDWSLSGNDYYNIDTPIVPANDPHPSPGQAKQAYFYSSQFGFTGGLGGYVGIQTDTNGKRAVFSIWEADQALCSDLAGAICQPFTGEGVGYQTMIPYHGVPDTPITREYGQ